MACLFRRLSRNSVSIVQIARRGSIEADGGRCMMSLQSTIQIVYMVSEGEDAAHRAGLKGRVDGRLSLPATTTSNDGRLYHMAASVWNA